MMVEYGMVLIAFAVVLGGTCYAALTPVVNIIVDDYNDAVGDGDISTDTASHFDNAIRVFRYVIPMLIMGMCILFGITRSQDSGENL